MSNFCFISIETAGKRVSKCIVTIRKLDDNEDECETDEKKEQKAFDSMDYIELGSDSGCDESNKLKHKNLHNHQHGGQVPRKKLKTS